jgi:hypothetical protein
MTCLDFENRLNDWLDRRQQVLPDELAAHTAYCAACREMHSRMLQMQRAVTTWRESLPTTSMSDVVLRRLRLEQDAAASDFAVRVSRSVPRESHVPAHRHSPLHRGSALLCSAAALVIVIGIGWRVSSNVSFAKRQNLAPNSMMVAVTQRPEAVTPLNQAGDRQLDVLLHDARDAYAALASQAWQQVSTADVLLPSGDVPSPFDREHSADEVSESLSRPLAPIGRDLRETVDSWFQQIFSNQDPST